MPHPNITTATVVDTCPTCGVTGKQLATHRHDPPASQRRLCYACGLAWTVGGDT